MESICETPKIKKPRVDKDWSDDEVFKLFMLVEKECCLWDARDEGYHNKILRDSAWRKIAEEFDEKFLVADLCPKWSNLRIQFRGYTSRKKTKSGQGVVEIPKWKFYNAMSFIGRAEVQQTEPTISNLFVEVETESNSFHSSTTPSPTLPTKNATTRRQPVGNNQSPAAQIAETMREAVTAIKERSQRTLDPNSTFANYLLSELQTLNNESAASVRKRVTLYFLECMEEERAKVS